MPSTDIWDRLMPTITEQFRAFVEAYLASSGVKPAEFGRQALGDPGFVLNLRRGRSCKLITADRVVDFIASQGGQNFGLLFHSRKSGETHSP